MDIHPVPQAGLPHTVSKDTLWEGGAGFITALLIYLESISRPSLVRFRLWIIYFPSPPAGRIHKTKALSRVEPFLVRYLTLSTRGAVLALINTFLYPIICHTHTTMPKFLLATSRMMYNCLKEV